MGYASDWGDVWNKSIQPMTKAKRHLIPELDPVWSDTGSLVGSLDKLDKLDPGKYSRPSEVKDKKKALEASLKEFKNLQKEKKKYAKSVDEAIKGTDKVVHKEVYRELKVIRTHLDWVESAVENQLTTHGKEMQKMNDSVQGKIDSQKEKMRKDGKSDEEIQESTQFLKFAKLLVTFPSTAKTAGAKAIKAIQAIKADPIPKTYNTEMDKGGRNYTQQINNAISLAQHKECPADLKTQLAGLIPYDADLKQFGGGAKRRVPLDADKTTILALTKEYSQLVKATIGYVDVVSKYIAKNKKKLGMK